MISELPCQFTGLMAGTSNALVAKDMALSYLASPMFEVIVGDSDGNPQQSFFVHKDLITSQSRFFAKALKDYAKPKYGNDSSKSDRDSTAKLYNSEPRSITWREGGEGIVKMPEDDPDVIANYIQLLYRGVLPIVEDPQEPPDSTTGAVETEGTKKAALEKLKAAEVAAIDRQYTALGNVYIFYEKIQDTKAKHAILSGFIEVSIKLRYERRRHFPASSTVTLVYAGTVASDPLRVFLADCYVLVGHSPWAGDGPTAFPKEFLYDVMVGMCRERPMPSSTVADKTKDVEHYHKKLDVFEKGGPEEK